MQASIIEAMSPEAHGAPGQESAEAGASKLPNSSKNQRALNIFLNFPAVSSQ